MCVLRVLIQRPDRRRRLRSELSGAIKPIRSTEKSSGDQLIGIYVVVESETTVVEIERIT